MKKQMTSEQKKELILTGKNNAYYQLIDGDNFGFFSDAFYIAEQSIIEVTGCYNTNNSMIAQKQVLLHMLNLGLL